MTVNQLSIYRMGWLVCVLVVLSISGAAQTHRIAGRITDERGAVLVNVTIKAEQLGGGYERTTQSDAQGNYQLELFAGEYQIRAVLAGFSIAEQKLSLTATVTLDFTLRPGQFTENVSVIATELASTQEEQRRISGSIEIIDARTLETTRPLNFNEALRKAPGVYTRDEEGLGLRPSIGLRGLDPNRSAKVLLLEDGIPLGHAPYGDTDAYYHPPIERYTGIEILKGSSQIGFGPNTLGGVINYVTPTPREALSGSVTLMGGNRAFFNGYGNVSKSFGKGAGATGLMMDFLRKQGDGARENIHSDLQDYLLKTFTKLDDSGRQTLSFKANYYGEYSNVAYSGLTQAEYDANQRFNPFKNDFFEGDRWGGSAQYVNALNANAVLTATLYASNFKRDWWRQSSNSDQRPNRRGRNGCNGLAELNTLCGNEGRLRSYETLGVDPRLKWHNRAGETDLGFRYHRESQNRIQLNNDTFGPNGRTGTLAEDNLRQNQAASGYVQHRFAFGKLAFTPGLRMERVNIERLNRINNSRGATTITQAIPGLGVSYSPSEKLTLFGGAHRGFAPPRPADLIDNNSGGIVELDPELSWNYEIGARSQPARGVKLNAAFFRLDYQNQIVPANLSGGSGTTLTSAGKTLHQGYEFDARLDTGAMFNSPHNLYFRAAYTWIDVAEYRGTRFSNVSGFNTISTRGNRTIYAPEHLLNATIGYSHPSGLDALIEATHTSRQFADDLNTIAPSANGQRGLIPAYTVWNATVNYRFSKLERFAPTVFVTTKNFMNDTYIVDRRRGVMPGIPRLLQGGIKFRF